jgi:transposase, IS30 family
VEVLVVERLVASERFWIELQAGASVATASQAGGVSHFTGYRWLAEAGGPDALGLARTRVGRPWGGRKSEEVRDVFWAGLRRGATITAAARAAGVARQTGAAWLTEAGGVRPRVIDLKLEAAVIPGSGSLSFTDRCRIEDLVKVGYSPARIADLVGRHRSTITRELARGRPHGQTRYRAVSAQNRVDQHRRRAGRGGQARAGQSTSCRGRGTLGPAAQSRADRGTAETGLPRRSGDVGVARGGVSVSV